ncbi:MAG: hypothetical protein AAB842_00350 [Patescibacteria group bacterium]
MFAIIESVDIHRRVMEAITRYFVDPSAFLNTWNKANGLAKDSGEVFIDIRKLNLLELLPEDLFLAIRNSKRPINEKALMGNMIIAVQTIPCSEHGGGECKIFPVGIRYVTRFKNGFWSFEWEAPLIRFSGHRRSFLSGSNGLFSYASGEFRVIRLLTSEPNIPLIFEGEEIKPEQLVGIPKEDRGFKEEEKREFYSSLKK